MKNAAILFAFLFCLFLNTFGQSKTVAKEEIHPEEYSVYKSILENWVIKPNTKQVVIRKFTSGSAVADSSISETNKARLVRGLNLETLEDYNSRHNKPFELKNNFGVEIPVKLVTDEELKPIFDKEKEKDFTETALQAMQKRYQTTKLVPFSRVSFDKSHPIAILHAEYLCGISCSSGYIYFLRKEDNRWTIVDTLHTRWAISDYR
jgi:hypothetical protein